jgi:hypothetical protein
MINRWRGRSRTWCPARAHVVIRHAAAALTARDTAFPCPTDRSAVPGGPEAGRPAVTLSGNIGYHRGMPLRVTLSGCGRMPSVRASVVDRLIAVHQDPPPAPRQIQEQSPRTAPGPKLKRYKEE